MAVVRFRQCGIHGRVIAFRPFLRLLAEIGRDLQHLQSWEDSSLQWEARTVELACHALEGYLTAILVDANLNAIHAKRTTVEPKDVQLARRVRGERS